MAESTINDLDLLTSVDRAADYFEVADTSDADASKRTTVNSMLNLTSQPVGINDVQTLTNKTLTSPAVSSPTLSGTVIGTYTLGGTPTFPASVVTLTGTQTLTNKTITSPTITSPVISNPTLTVDTISEYTSANGVTIDGLSIKDAVLNTANSVPNTALSNTGSFGSGWAWPTWTPTWTNLSVGNGTLTAKSSQVGKTVKGKLILTFGTTTSISGSVSFTLPVTAATVVGSAEPIGSMTYFDLGSAVYDGRVLLSNTTTATLRVIRVDAARAVTEVFSSTVPVSAASGDQIAVYFEYEAA